MLLTVERKKELPLYLQLAGQIRERVRSGALTPGSRLPAVRVLAKELGLTRLTVQNAYALLQTEGLLESFVGKGTFVSQPVVQPGPFSHAAPAPVMPAIQWPDRGLIADMLCVVEQPHLLSLAKAVPDLETMPLRQFGRFLTAALHDPTSVSYGPAQGEECLRQEVAHLLLDRGIVTAPELVVITDGAQQAINLLFSALLEPGEVVMVEELTYPGVLEIAARKHQPVLSLPLDNDGLNLEAVKRACETYHPRLLYSVPTFHNPTGASLGAEKRKQLIELAHRYDFYIIEDDIYGFLNYDFPAPLPLKALEEPTAGQQGRVIYLTSFSKMLMPGLRIGAMLAPFQLLPALLATRSSQSLFCSPLLQRALADYLRRGMLGSHLQKVRSLYKGRRDATLAALAQFMAGSGCEWVAPEGGMCIQVKLPMQISEREFYLQAVQRGVGVVPGLAFMAQPAAEHNPFIRLSFTSQPFPRLKEGISILAGVLREQLQPFSTMAFRPYRRSGPLV